MGLRKMWKAFDEIPPPVRSKVNFKIGFCCHLLCSYKEGLSLANVWYYTVPFSKVDDAIDPE